MAKRSLTALILGGGVGGIVVANRLSRNLPAAWRIVVVDRSPEHVFAPSLLWVMHGTRQAAQVRRPLRSLLRPRVELLCGDIKQIDAPAQSVSVNEQAIPYDFLVIALGAALDPGAIPGMAEAGSTFYTFDGSLRLNRELESFAGGSVAVVVAATPYKCPGAPHEATMLIDDVFRRRGIRNKVRLHLFTPESQPLPVAGPRLGESVAKLLESKGISFHPQHKLTEVSSSDRTLAFENKEKFHFDLLVSVPPHRSPEVVRDSGLVGESGWISVDRYTLCTADKNVYAIGDVTSIPLPGRWRADVPLMLPKAGVFAHAQAITVAQHITARAAGGASSARFCGEGFCMLEAGEDLAGFAFGDFFAEPAPDVKMKPTGAAWHYGKVLFEKWWLEPHGVNKNLFAWALKAGARVYGAPFEV